MQGNVRPVIDAYHRLIENDLNAAEEQVKMLYQLQHDRKILFGDRPMAHSLRPAFLSETAHTQIQDTVYLIRQAILKIAAAHFNTREALDELGMTPEEIELAAIPTNVIRLSATARMDAFLTPTSFKFVELNAESPAGVGYTHKMAQVYRELPIFQEFVRKYPVRFVSPLEHLVQGLLRTYHEEFEGTVEKPSFAIIDFQNIPTIHEFAIVKEYLERLGYPCEVADPRDVECIDGWVYVNGRKIDILYRRLLTNEYLEIKDECPAFLEGYKAQKTCYLNSFRSKLVHKKSIFAFLTDPKYTGVLNTVELQTIRNHIPWTRKIRDQQTIYKGQTIHLLDYIYRHRNEFVIKPNDEYGGKGVVLGFAATDQEWAEGIELGIREGFVVQEVVDISREPFLLKTAHGWQSVPTVVDLDPYLNGPLMGGCLVRTSTTNLANVTAGGGSLPVFILRYVR
jgi:uncharacterized circularly permuted ATP-grasp superfamily protein